jgi:hypothetical protein
MTTDTFMNGLVDAITARTRESAPTVKRSFSEEPFSYSPILDLFECFAGWRIIPGDLKRLFQLVSPLIDSSASGQCDNQISASDEPLSLASRNGRQPSNRILPAAERYASNSVVDMGRCIIRIEFDSALKMVAGIFFHDFRRKDQAYSWVLSIFSRSRRQNGRSVEMPDDVNVSLSDVFCNSLQSVQFVSARGIFLAF